MMQVPAGLEQRGDGDVLIAVPVFGLTWYTDKAFSTIPKSVLDVANRFFSLCPPEELRWYATENMSKHKAATKKTASKKTATSRRSSRAGARKPAARKATARKSTARKTTARKSTARKTAARKRTSR